MLQPFQTRHQFQCEGDIAGELLEVGSTAQRTIDFNVLKRQVREKVSVRSIAKFLVLPTSCAIW